MSANFSKKVLKWFDQHGRTHLPWQQNRNAYRVWVSEIMLQQTQVATVIPYFERFMQRFPDVQTLAAATQDEVLQHWSGLGYYARGRNLHKCAQTIVADYQGEFPETVDELETLPGIGRSTAGAIVSLSLDRPATILDGNVKRVLTRFFGVAEWPGQSKTAQQLWQYAEALTPAKRCADYTQAMMDLGATLCTRTKPECQRCPLNSECVGYIEGEPEQYPAKKPKKRLPVKSVYFLIIKNHQGILLEQRPSTGIWGGLWSFPELEEEGSITTHCENHFGEVNSHKLLSPFRHTFSHYHLDIHPVHVQLSSTHRQIRNDDRQRWFSEDEWLTIGLAAPVKKLLSRLPLTQESLDLV